MTWTKRALELFPDDARMVSLQGLVYAHQGMVQRALGCSDYAMNLSGADPLSWVLRGEILALAANKNAMFCFEKAMETRMADDWQTPLRIGLFFYTQKRWPQALDYLKIAVQNNTRNDYLWTRLGQTNERLGMSHPALDAYRAALELNSLNRNAELGMARVAGGPFFMRWLRRLKK
jgi:tetratricopeptide (TPR) repeat protein